MGLSLTITHYHELESKIETCVRDETSSLLFKSLVGYFILKELEILLMWSNVVKPLYVSRMSFPHILGSSVLERLQNGVRFMLRESQGLTRKTLMDLQLSVAKQAVALHIFSIIKS